MNPSLRAIVCVTLSGLAMGPAAAENTFRAGVAAVDISPTSFPRRIAGGFLEGRGEKNTDPLHARCFVLDDGKTKLAFAIVDTCMMTQALIDEAKSLAAGQCGMAVDHMMVSATHTHSAPAAMGCLGTRQDKDYAAFLVPKIAEGVVAAAKNLQPARIGWASIDDWEHTHNRRWIRKAGSEVVDPFGDPSARANMHPGYLSKDVIGPSGPVDPELSVISLQTRDGKPLGVLANYSQHYFGSTPVSADYYGAFCRHLAQKMGQSGDGHGTFVCAMSQGTSGDLMWMDYGVAKKNFTMDTYAGAVAAYAMQAVQKVQYRDTVSLGIVEKILPMNYRVPDEKRLAWARPLAAKIQNDLPKDKPEVYAREAIILHERQKTSLKLQAIRIGDLTIGTLPNEVYAITGLKLKAQSPSAAHFNIELANGAEGYIPPPEQHALGGYTTWPARTAGLEVRAEPKEVETLLGALEEVTGQPRRAMPSEQGLYAQTVLDAKPVAYWRLEEAAGRTATNAVPGGVDAQVFDGAAWYLPGVGSGTGYGDGEALKPSAFSGARQINRALHLAGGRVEAGVKTGDKASVVLWFWLGHESGAGERSGLLAQALGAKLAARQSADHRVRLALGDSTTKESWRADEWHFAVLVRDDLQTRLFVDGAISPALEAPANPTPEKMVFGSSLEGKMDEIAVFDRALPPGEMATFWKLSGLARSAAAESSPQTKMESAPLSPEESLKKIHVPDGFEIELVAAEPLVLDPVAFDWDERGRLWVVEMADYPLGMDGHGKPGGRVRILEDTDGDGRYDKSSIFADDLNFPTGILCWRGGCLVTAAPEVLFLKDTKNTGRADVRQTLLSGFLEGNQQLRVNGLRWGLDGWVYCANGGHHVNYGKEIAITSTLTGQKFALGSRDFRFKPETGEFDPLSGPSQFGRNRDAWGHWFGVQNSYPIWHYVLEDRYLRRNPHVASPNPRNVMTGSNPPVFPLSGEQKRYHSFNQAGHFTSACAATPYLDTQLFGDGRLHSFTCEPVHDVVQHFIVEDDGVSFKAHRAESESQPDFFASEDRWCRPVMTRTGPDGALWIADMYRYMIEHPAWLPQNGKDDFLPFYRAGDDKGRIYRIYPKGKRPSLTPTLEGRGLNEWVALLESPNGWVRDRAQMHLQWRGDREAAPALEKLARESKVPLARAHALSALEDLHALREELLIAAFHDPISGVREHALRLAEIHSHPAVVRAAAELADDPDPKVRLQLACSLGEWKQDAAGDALVKLAEKDRDDPMMRGAIISSLLPHLSKMAVKLHEVPALMDPLLRVALAEEQDEIVLLVSQGMLPDAGRAEDRALRDFRGLLQVLRANKLSLEKLAAQHVTDSRWAVVLRKKNDLLQWMRDRAGGGGHSPSAQALAASILMADPTTEPIGVERLGALLAPQLHLDPFAEYVMILSQSEDPRIPGLLMRDWEGHTPVERLAILDALLSREPSIMKLLDEVRTGKIASSSFDAQRQARLLKHPSARVRKLAGELFTGSGNESRAKVLEAFKPALSLTGDAAKGKAVFAVACVACHQLDGVGRALGPDLRSVVGHDPDKLLNSILDPSANIEPGFTAYFCELKSGEQLYGIISGESGGSIDFKLADASVRNLLRSDIVKLQSSKASLMPDGLEAVLTPQSLADLIAYLKVPK